MKKNKAFTLIELLAVIVILAIIALIAVPVVVNIINDSKKSSEEESLKLYEDAVQKMIVKKQMQDPSFNPSECKIKEDGNLECTVGTNKALVEVEVKGTKPNKGTVAIKENKISLKNVELNGKKYYQIAILKEDVSPTGISRGDKYTYKVNNKDTFTFYVLSIEGDKVNLIMDRNICGSATDANASTNGQAATADNTCLIAWYDDGNNPVNYDNDTNEFGPVTAMQGLYNATKDWINVPDIDLSGDNKYEDEGRKYAEDHNYGYVYGYGTIETIETGIKITKKDKITEVTREGNQMPVIPYEEGKTLKARLPKLEEVYNTGTDTNHCHDGKGSCPTWLTNGLAKYLKYYPDNDYIEGIKRYWLLSSLPGNSSYIYSVYYYGYVNNGTASNDGIGIRAVITVSKSDL